MSRSRAASAHAWGVASANPPAAAVRAEENEVTDLFGVAHGVGDGNGPALRQPEQRELFNTSGVDHQLEVVHPSVEVKGGDVPVRQPAATLVVADEATTPRQVVEPV